MIVLMMNDQQLAEAAKHFELRLCPNPAMSVPLATVKTALMNHWRSCMKMPAGGVSSTGSMQTGFEMHLISAATAKILFRTWPNYEHIKMGHSWEARTMEDCALVCGFQEPPAGWGFGNAKPAPPIRGSKETAATLIVATPITVTWQLKSGTTSVLSVRAPLIIYTEDDAVILPPDDKEGTPFYKDPEDEPGLHRDLFRKHALKMTKALMEEGHAFTQKLQELVNA